MEAGKKILAPLAAIFIWACSNEINVEILDDYYSKCEATDEILENFIVIQFDSGNEPIVYNSYKNDVAIMLNEENVTVQNTSNNGTEYNLVVSGTTENGSLKIYGNHRMGLYLNDVSISNSSGPAINIQNRQKISVHLLNGTRNYLADGTPYEIVSGEDAKGTFFSEGQISFSGCGILEVVGNHSHAIAVDNDLEIESGKIIAKTTGIKSHGISVHSAIISNNANIKIETSGNGAKGIKSDGFIAIRGGTTDIKTSGKVHIDNSVQPPDTSSATGLKTDDDMEISGGTLKIQSSGIDAKGINVAGNLTVTGGDIKINANDDGVKVHGNLFVDNENFCVWSLKKQDIDCNGIETIKGNKCVAGY
jgi:hypothetical protein